jgi:hypothetical protein
MGANKPQRSYMLQIPAKFVVTCAAVLHQSRRLPAHSRAAHVQEVVPGVLEEHNSQMMLASALNRGLEALSQVDAVLAATEKCSKDSAAPIWQALARGDDSVRAVLDITEAEIVQHAAGRLQHGDMGSIAPLSLTFYGVVSGLRQHCKSVLFEVSFSLQMRIG